MPRFGLRAAPLDPLTLDLKTVRELARALSERLDGVTAFGSCLTCHEAEARAFLARLRRVRQLSPGSRARAGEGGPVVVYANDDEQALQAYVARRERMAAELVVVVRSRATRPLSVLPPWG